MSFAGSIAMSEITPSTDSAVERAGLPTINEGDRFEFDIEVDRRGKYAAVNLQPLT